MEIRNFLPQCYGLCHIRALAPGHAGMLIAIPITLLVMQVVQMYDYTHPSCFTQ